MASPMGSFNKQSESNLLASDHQIPMNPKRTKFVDLCPDDEDEINQIQDKNAKIFRKKNEPVTQIQQP